MLKVEVLTEQQADILRDVQAAIRGDGPRILCYPAGHGLGKSHLCGRLAIWGGATTSRALVLTTAPTWRQVEKVLWKEINYAWAEADMPGVCNLTEFTLPNNSSGYGLSTNEPQKFQGAHAPHVRAFVDEAPGVDPRVIEVLIRGIAVNEDFLIVLIGNPIEPSGAFFDLCEEPKRSKEKGFDPRVKVRYLSALDHPNVIHRVEIVPGAVSFRACQEMIDDYCDEITDPVQIAALVDARAEMLDGKTPNGVPHNPWAHAVEDMAGKMQAIYWNPVARLAGESESLTRIHDSGSCVWFAPSPIVQSRMLGRFPDEGDDILIPMRWVESAMSRGEDVIDRLHQMQAGQIPASRVPEWNPSAPACVAMDVARHGVDSTVIMTRRGRVVLPCVEYRQQTLDITAIRFVEEYRKAGAEFGALDVGAFGWGVHDHITSNPIYKDVAVVPIDFGSGPDMVMDQVQFLNKRAQMFWNLRCKLEKNAIDLPRDAELMNQLCSIRYTFTNTLKIQIESKKDMKKRGLKSPDRADTLAMLCDEAIDGAWEAEDQNPDWFVQDYEERRIDGLREGWAEVAREKVWG